MSKNNPYILHLKTIKQKDEELTGHKAFEKGLLIREGFSTMPSFVLTSVAFDDYLRSTNLVEPISLLLDEVKPFIRETAETVSEEIRNLIMRADIPKLIDLPMLEAYKTLSPVLEDSFVKVEVSNVIEKKFIPKSLNFKIQNIKGAVQLHDAIKEGWLTLFTPDALEYRVNEYYQGPLSVALIISRIAAGDVSGEFVYTAEDKAEIRALYGVGSIEESRTDADVYFINPKTGIIQDKKINRQVDMKIRKGSSRNNKEVLMSIEISDEWKERQKVPDILINNIAEIATKLYQQIKRPTRFNWSIEAGTIYIEDYEVLEFYEQPSVFIEEKDVEVETKEKPQLPKISLDKEDSDKSLVMLNNSSVKLQDSVLDATKGSKSQKDNLVKTILDISDMTPSRINGVKFFENCYFDGTKSIFESGALAEFDDPKKAIESIYVELLAAMRTASMKNFIYSFSNLKYSSNDTLDDRFTGDERFIDNPQELLAEYIALRKATSLLKLDEISFVLPSLRSFNNLTDLLRILQSYSGYKNIENKVYAEISIPSFLFELSKISDQVDGFVLDYYKLLKLTVYRKNLRAVDNQIMFDLINEIRKVCDHKNLDFYIKLDLYKEPVIEQIIQMAEVNPKKGNMGIIFRSVPPQEILDLIRGSDKSKLNTRL